MFEQYYEKYPNFLSENFHFFGVGFTIFEKACFLTFCNAGNCRIFAEILGGGGGGGGGGGAVELLQKLPHRTE